MFLIVLCHIVSYNIINGRKTKYILLARRMMKYKYIKLSKLKNNSIKTIRVGHAKKVKTIKVKCGNTNFECNLTPKEVSRPDDSSLNPKRVPKRKPKHKTKK